jgi:hypothetical protein
MIAGPLARGSVVVLVSALLAGCLGNRSEPAAPASTVRASVVTAPADLQLLCASEAATRFGAASDAVLPVSSAQTAGGTYEVRLTVDGAPATCVVDDDANIRSLERA